MKVWTVTRLRFEHDEATGEILRRHDEVERLDGRLSEADVARHLELKFARLYQPRWDEARSTPEERAARGPAGEIVVGYEPRFVARLVDVDLS